MRQSAAASRAHCPEDCPEDGPEDCPEDCPEDGREDGPEDCPEDRREGCSCRIMCRSVGFKSLRAFYRTSRGRFSVRPVRMPFCPIPERVRSLRRGAS